MSWFILKWRGWSSLDRNDLKSWVILLCVSVVAVVVVGEIELAVLRFFCGGVLHSSVLLCDFPCAVECYWCFLLPPLILVVIYWY